MSVLDTGARVNAGEVSAVALANESLQQIDSQEGEIHAFVEIQREQVLRKAQAIDDGVAQGKNMGVLAGVPLALKDNLCQHGEVTSCASNILSGWRPPYDATVVSRIETAGVLIVGKTNMDEFAMGSSTENSAFGPTKNPHDTTKVPGGSSGGSAAAVAASMTPLSLGSDTGGSIRQPAAFCGVVGVKPTYGLVSRYGLVAFASSLDQVGPFAGSVADAAALLEVIAGHDPKDSTSLNAPAPALSSHLDDGVKGMRVGLCNELLEGCAPDMVAAIKRAAEVLSNAGAEIIEISIPELKLGLSAYYLIAPAEASSNLARYDGVRYGVRVDAEDVTAMNTATRTAGFGDEVKRRIMLGTYALSAGYYDAYYGQAQRVRTLIINAFTKAYSSVDLLLGATTPTTAFAIGDKVGDPMSMYQSDICTIPTNLAGHPALSVPFGVGDDKMPIGAQLLGPALSEQQLFQAASVLEHGANS
ncbi:MAG: Asp-tRNA(Asn)/Glu-tRNA(Gln) amidotransferase subunit GatA [Actinobacteria bacterium]|nr:Asp-tRNA(Asn)/Glu-tRNA(Gln) amidotransferase subunit GatA [Actinomycetota bacterium]MSX10470.1 Asp-tRNA(Asn)/Glu-tRNA(Gln) amidotransferase subunit GatA [Actinomycetota bacterium]MSX67523.1 Asp-tRNA(Asn)/Glu-tRNA(Gln) amidotransferase subunit GatA [Actinomycetota bacterium]